MLWTFVLAQGPHTTSVTPVDAATSSITGYILGFGPLGIFALVMAFLLFRGWRLMSPAALDAERAAARTDSRGDLLEERTRIIGEKTHAEEQRDEALHIAQTQIAPLLLQFNGTVTALLPLLQEMVARREGGHDGSARR